MKTNEYAQHIKALEEAMKKKAEAAANEETVFKKFKEQFNLYDALSSRDAAIQTVKLALADSVLKNL